MVVGTRFLRYLVLGPSGLSRDHFRIDLFCVFLVSPLCTSWNFFSLVVGEQEYFLPERAAQSSLHNIKVSSNQGRLTGNRTAGGLSEPADLNRPAAAKAPD